MNASWGKVSMAFLTVVGVTLLGSVAMATCYTLVFQDCQFCVGPLAGEAACMGVIPGDQEETVGVGACDFHACTVVQVMPNMTYKYCECSALLYRLQGTRVLAVPQMPAPTLITAANIEMLPAADHTTCMIVLPCDDGCTNQGNCQPLLDGDGDPVVNTWKCADYALVGGACPTPPTIP